MSDMGSLSGIDRQNVMRLRVNRIALVQELRIEHILQPLMDSGVISELDKRRIDVGTTPADKARRLIDIITSKTQVPDWYQKFRDAMVNPDGANSEVKKRYRSLVDFLDNTVIHRPTSQASKFSASSSTSSMKLPHYQPLPEISHDEKSKRRTQNVLKLDEERKKPPMDEGEEKGARDTVPEREDKMVAWVEVSSQTVTLVKGFFQQWVSVPDNYRSLIQAPEEHFQKIAGGNTADDKSQLVQETLVLEKVRKLELIAVLSRRKQLPQGFELCMCEVVQEILFDKDNYHFYFKYLRQLEVQEVNLLLDVVDSYASIMSNMDPSKGSSENTKQAIKLGFSLIDFLGDYGYYTQAELIMTVLLMVLNQSHNLDIWLAKYKGYVKLMHYRNLNYEFLKVQSAYHLASEMKWQIKMMSFGQNILDKTEFFIEMSHYMLELGSANAAFGWAQKALRSTKTESPSNMVNALCAAVMAYSSKWLVKKAEIVAVEAVQQAKYHFGTRHPLYVKALLHFCHFSTEFKQDKATLDIAKHTLESAKLTYGCEVIQVALAHRAVCKALLVLQNFEDQSYHFHATESLKMARKLLPPQHPMMYLFLHTSASALQWKAIHSSKEMQEAALRLAESEAREALEAVMTVYGDISLRTAQMCSLLGQIYSKVDNHAAVGFRKLPLQLAEEHLQKSVIFMKLCLPQNSNFLLLAMATLGTFYKIIGKPKEAIELLKNVVKYSDCGIYLKWVHVCYENLIATLQSMNNNKEADEYQIQLAQWLRDNKVYDRVVTLEELSAKPRSFSDFMEEFDKWDKTKQKVKDLAKKQLFGKK